MSSSWSDQVSSNREEERVPLWRLTVAISGGVPGALASASWNIPWPNAWPTWPNARTRPSTPVARGAVEKHHAKGKLTARERIDYLLDEGSFQELDMLARHRAHGMGLEDNRPYTDGVVTGFGTIDGRRVCIFSQDFTVFGGCAGRGLRREDPQGHGPGRLHRRAHDRAQRRGGGPHSGGRRLAALLRRHLPPQRRRLGRDPPDQRDPRALRRGRRLLAGHDRLHLHGAGHLAHVHHGARRREDGDRRGRHARRARRRHEPRHQVRRGHLRLARREGLPRRRAPPAVVPAVEQSGGAAARAERATSPTAR